MLAPVRAPTSVVLVDDYGDLRALYRAFFERTDDFTVVGEAGDGLEGLRVATERQPDLVLLDIAMPVMDGLEALPLILAACPGTTVVALTAQGIHSGIPDQAASLGSAGYILKGTPMPTVLTELREILRRKQQPSAASPDQ